MLLECCEWSADSPHKDYSHTDHAAVMWSVPELKPGLLEPRITLEAFEPIVN